MNLKLISTCILGMSLYFIGCTTHTPSEASSESDSNPLYRNLTPDQIEANSNNAEIRGEYASVYNAIKTYSIYQDSIKSASSYLNVQMLLDDINDRFTTYYNPAQAFDILSQLSTSDVQGILGLRFRLFPKKDTLSQDTLVIASVFDHSGAKDSGLQMNDRVLEINNKSLLNLGAATLDSLFAWDGDQVVGSSVTFKLKRKDSVFTKVVYRKEVPIPTVFVDSVAPGISMITLTWFAPATLDDPENQVSGGIYGSWKEIRKALDSTKNEKTTLFDLRNNGGGSINQCDAISDEFVASGEMFRIINRENLVNGQDPLEHHNAQSGGLGESRNFIFLANRHSASCSEILLTSVRENRQFPIVGDTSYGKGIGQSFHQGTLVAPVYNSTKKAYEDFISFVKVTSLQVRTKKDVSYQGIGLMPDYLIPASTPSADSVQLAKAIELAQAKNASLARTHKITAPKIFAEVPNLSLTNRQFLPYEMFRLNK